MSLHFSTPRSQFEERDYPASPSRNQPGFTRLAGAIHGNAFRALAIKLDKAIDLPALPRELQNAITALDESVEGYQHAMQPLLAYIQRIGLNTKQHRLQGTLRMVERSLESQVDYTKESSHEDINRLLEQFEKLEAYSRKARDAIKEINTLSADINEISFSFDTPDKQKECISVPNGTGIENKNLLLSCIIMSYAGKEQFNTLNMPKDMASFAQEAGLTTTTVNNLSDLLTHPGLKRFTLPLIQESSRKALEEAYRSQHDIRVFAAWAKAFMANDPNKDDVLHYASALLGVAIPEKLRPKGNILAFQQPLTSKEMALLLMAMLENPLIRFSKGDQARINDTLSHLIPSDEKRTFGLLRNLWHGKRDKFHTTTLEAVNICRDAVRLISNKDERIHLNDVLYSMEHSLTSRKGIKPSDNHKTCPIHFWR